MAGWKKPRPYFRLVGGVGRQREAGRREGGGMKMQL